MKILLTDVNEKMVRAWEVEFADVEQVTTRHGSIFDKPADAIISPANSFGFMDGGIDLALSMKLGWHVQKRLQKHISEIYHGELLVGQAAIVPTDHDDFPYLISAPTMRVPTVLGAATINPYLATRAVLLLVKYGSLENGRPVSDVVQTLAIPGLGTGIGKVPVKLCAHQMRQAVNEVLLDTYTYPDSWVDAMRRQERLTPPIE